MAVMVNAKCNTAVMVRRNADDIMKCTNEIRRVVNYMYLFHIVTVFLDM